MHLKPTAFLLITGWALSVCASASENITPGSSQGECLNGFSGMANLGDNRYLAVHDKKPHHPGERLSIIHVYPESNFSVSLVQVDDWKHPDGPSSDLEAVCQLDGHENEFLAIESGHWDGRFGRMFHLKLDGESDHTSASIIHAYDVPEFNAKGQDDPSGDEFEGLECAVKNQQEVLVIIGERGGSAAYTNGKLRWATLNLTSKELVWSEAGKKGKTLDAPGVWIDSDKNRDITALHLDDNDVLWAIASEDAGDTGPFKSLLYRIGTIDANTEDPIKPFDSYAVTRRSDGLKIEALAGPSDAIPDSIYAIATEDECFGGIWRPLK